MTTPTADLLAESVEALLREWTRDSNWGRAHLHGKVPCGPGCPAWTRNAAEAALERWRLERQP